MGPLTAGSRRWLDPAAAFAARAAAASGGYTRSETRMAAAETTNGPATTNEKSALFADIGDGTFPTDSIETGQFHMSVKMCRYAQ
jgi:hypothetical protein